MSIRPQDLPELRVELAARIISGQSFSEFRDTDQQLPESEIAHYLMGFCDLAKKAELFYVSASMTDLARVAAESLDTFTPEAGDVPTPLGLVFFDGDTGEMANFTNGFSTPLRGILWGHAEGSGQLVIIPVVDHPHGGLYACVAACWGVPLGESATKCPTDGTFQIHESFALLLTTWLLMAQPLAEVSTEAVDRAARKRLMRSGYQPSDIRVIELRRPAGNSNGDGSSNYHHQWIVRGHWRQHWYPKRQVHRPVWIAPHVKGPEGAPLIGGEKVYALKR